MDFHGFLQLQKLEGHWIGLVELLALVVWHVL